MLHLLAGVLFALTSFGAEQSDLIHTSLEKPLRKIVILGNFPPRRCGIATFTNDLSAGISALSPTIEVDVIAMSDLPCYGYPSEVKYQIAAQDYAAYRPTADFINQGGYDVLSVQHEYGIFGGSAGSYLLTLLRQVNIPIITTLHTVLRHPDAAQRAVTSEIIELSERIIVMSACAIEILMTEYRVLPSKIDLVPHGIPDFSGPQSKDVKGELAIHGPMILTFGLLSPDKGIEYAIQAMPAILATSPQMVYVILGATHPSVRMTAGDAYRESLVRLAKNLGVESNVRFVDSFVSQADLLDYLRAADIYITPYLNPQQITSGTLSYALGSGKAVISTRYVYAEELLADDRGLLVPFRDADAIAESILYLESHVAEMNQMGQRATAYGEQRQWSAVALQYRNCFCRGVREHTERHRILIDFHWVDRNLPLMSTKHLAKMTDDTGMFQHAIFNLPNRAHGYCVDDNARALLFTAYMETSAPLTPHLFDLQSRYLSFVHDSFNPLNGKFRNFMSYARGWLEDTGSDDSHARTLWSLGAITGRSNSVGHRAVAEELFQAGTFAIYGMRSPRSWGYAVLAADEYLRRHPTDTAAHALREQMADRLWSEYKVARSDDWRWFEDVASYANARLSQALIVSGQWLGNHGMLAAGLESLTWLMAHQTNAAGQFSPIGSEGFSRRGEHRAEFDQQPLEAWASVSACLSAGQASGNPAWVIQAESVFRWFLGANALGQSVYDEVTGGCRDGLHRDRLNENQGAESTLSFLCSLAEIESALRSPAIANTSGLLL